MSNKLNVVGETHSVSKARRELEKRFCRIKAKSDNYWEEAGFPDLKVGAPQSNQYDAAADLMEFRATFAAAYLVAKFDKLGDEGISVSATRASEAGPVLTKFDGELRTIAQMRDRLDKSWRPSTLEVDQAVRAVFGSFQQAFQAYDAAYTNGSTEQQLKAVRNFVNTRVNLRDLVPALVDAVKVPVKDKRDANELQIEMRRQCSLFMGLGAIFSKQVGVWKVGNRHIIDLTDGTVKVDKSRTNIVSKGDFNHELQAWQDAGEPNN